MIADLKARRIAAEWHSGQSSPLYAFASSGAVSMGAINEASGLAEYERAPDASPADRRDLRSLLEYLRTVGLRGPVAGWADLTW